MPIGYYLSSTLLRWSGASAVVLLSNAIVVWLRRLCRRCYTLIVVGGVPPLYVNGIAIAAIHGVRNPPPAIANVPRDKSGQSTMLGLQRAGGTVASGIRALTDKMTAVGTPSPMEPPSKNKARPRHSSQHKTPDARPEVS